MNACIALLLAAAVVVKGQIQVCSNAIKPGKVPATSIKQSSTAYSNSFSSLTVNWPRPQDGPSGGMPSCITEYLVEVSGRDGRVFQSAVEKVTPAHLSASYTAKGLSPGQPYQFAVTAKGPAGTGPTDIRSTPFTAAPATANCRQPQSVGNIRRAGATPSSGGKVSMTIAWDKAGDPAECVKEYVVTVYEAGSKTALKSTVVLAPTTQFTDNIYQPGRTYEFNIYARNPAAGAMGNGINLRSPPITAPTTAVPL